MHLQELARRNETDAEQASKLASLRFDDLNNRFQELQQEHVGCKSLIAEQEKELEILRTLSLPTNEAAQLLQEMVTIARYEFHSFSYNTRLITEINAPETSQSPIVQVVLQTTMDECSS